MEKKLNKMKSEIEARSKRLMGLIVCAMGLLTLSVTDVISINLGNENANDFVAGFQLGILCVLLLAFAAKLVNYRKALKDDKLLKQIYYKENDERVCFISQQVGKSSMSITTVVLLIAAIIAGYFNIIVFITILAVTAVQLLIQLMLYWYFDRHMTGEDTE